MYPVLVDIPFEKMKENFLPLISFFIVFAIAVFLVLRWFKLSYGEKSKKKKSEKAKQQAFDPSKLSSGKKSIYYTLEGLQYLSFILIIFTLAAQLPEDIINKIDLRNYGVFIALGFIVGLLLVMNKAKKVGVKQEKVAGMFMWILIPAIIGSRLFSQIFAYNKDFPAGNTFFQNAMQWITDFFDFLNGGMVVYGGFIFGLGFGIYYVWKNKMGIARMADMAAPSVAIGFFFGRIGCFLAGCCYGKSCSVEAFPRASFDWFHHRTDLNSLLSMDSTQALGMVNGIDDSPTFDHFFRSLFHNDLLTGHLDLVQWFYPYQIMAAVDGLIAFIVLESLYRLKKGKDGMLFLFFMLLYPVNRTILETIRGDVIDGSWVYELIGLTDAQLISICLIAVSLGMITWMVFRNKSKTMTLSHNA